jgi:myo-inositol-1(or 4)-monophosphatase
MPTHTRSPLDPADGAGRATLTGEQLTALTQLAEQAARTAGELVHARRPDRLEINTKSSPTDVVTQMDTAAEELLRSTIRARRPDDGLLGEEAGLQVGSSGLTWVIDPIDGTVNYLYGLPAYAVSVAVVTGDPGMPGGWTPVAGCVHSPAAGLTWTATAGAGAFLDGRRLRMAEPPPLAGALTGTGFGYRAQRRQNQARVLAELLPRVRDIRRIGCAAMDLCMVAAGQLDVYFERGLHAWDLAAGMLVVTEAGGRVRGLGELPPGEPMVIAGREPLTGLLADLLAELDAGRDDG